MLAIKAASMQSMLQEAEFIFSRLKDGYNWLQVKERKTSQREAIDAHFMLRGWEKI